MCDKCATLWTISSDLIPANHAEHVRQRAYRPYGGHDIAVLEITPEWTYYASPADEIIYDSNNYVAREELAAYSDGMGGSCADHIVTSRGMLAVPLWRDDDAGPAGGYHPAAIVGLALIAQIDEYPLLDEDDYSEREYNAWIEYLTDEFRWIDDGEREDSVIDSHLTRFLQYAWENLIGDYSVYDVPADDIDRAYKETKEETVNA